MASICTTSFDASPVKVLPASSRVVRSSVTSEHGILTLPCCSPGCAALSRLRQRSGELTIHINDATRLREGMSCVCPLPASGEPMGLSLRKIKKDQNTSQVDTLMITDIDANSAAARAEPPFKPGDRLRAVGAQRVSTATDVKAELARRVAIAARSSHACQPAAVLALYQSSRSTDGHGGDSGDGGDGGDAHASRIALTISRVAPTCILCPKYGLPMDEALPHILPRVRLLTAIGSMPLR